MGTDSSTPLDAVTPSYVHVMWLDNRSGTFQIYYRRRSVSASTGDGDAGTSGGATNAGCGCRTTAPDPASASLFVLVVIALRRRRAGCSEGFGRNGYSST